MSEESLNVYRWCYSSRDLHCAMFRLYARTALIACAKCEISQDSRAHVHCHASGRLICRRDSIPVCSREPSSGVSRLLSNAWGAASASVCVRLSVVTMFCLFQQRNTYPSQRAKHVATRGQLVGVTCPCCRDLSFR